MNWNSTMHFISNIIKCSKSVHCHIMVKIDGDFIRIDYMNNNIQIYKCFSPFFLLIKWKKMLDVIDCVPSQVL